MRSQGNEFQEFSLDVSVVCVRFQWEVENDHGDEYRAKALELLARAEVESGPSLKVNRSRTSVSGSTT